MRHIRYKLLTGSIQGLYSSKHLVKRICDQLCFRIIRNWNFLILESICDILNSLCDFCKRLYQDSGQNISEDQHQDTADHKNPQSFLLKNIDTWDNFFRWNTDQQNSLCPFSICTGNRHSHLNITVFPVIIAALFQFLKALDHFLGNHIFSFVKIICILDYLKILIHNQNTATIYIREHCQLTVNSLWGRILEIILFCQLIHQDITLILYIQLSVWYRPILVTVYDSLFHNDTWHNTNNDQNH